MTDKDFEVKFEKAQAFFERAEEVATTGNFDYAIEMYIRGLQKLPDAVEEGHIALRRMSLLRQGKGGKKPTVVERLKHHGGKTSLEEMLSAEFLLAKDPDHLPYAETMLKTAVAGEFKKTAEWIAALVYEANYSSVKPSINTYLLLKDSYKTLEMYSKAVVVCRHAMQIKPDNAQLQDELRDLSAQMAVQNGKYASKEGFTESIRDREKQDQLHEQGKLVKSDGYRAKEVDDARKAMQTNPDSQTNIIRMANALFEMKTDRTYNDAKELLENAYAKTQDFTFKRHQGEMEIRELRRQVRKAKADVRADIGNGQLKSVLQGLKNEVNKTETEHYKLCLSHYPTDLLIKYEYGICLARNKQYDEAIPMFQEAQRDPRRKLAAMDETGLCFFLKGWYADAIDIFERAVNLCEIEDDEVTKDLRYNLARSYEENGNTEKATEQYSKLVQIDFNYKDIRHRIDRLRNESD